jgi:type VI secretion system protein ImpG
MDDLLKAYELEIVQLRLLSSEFARRYPKVAGKLQIASDVCEDPHVERLIQSVALIAARVSKRLDDDYPQFTERLLDVLHPHYMRPFPSCAIIRFDTAAVGAVDAPSNSRVSSGTILESAPVQGVPCRFRTIYDVVEPPVRIAAARFTALITAPPGVRLPVDASCSIDIDIEKAADVALEEHSSLRLFVDGEASFSATLLDTLFLHTVCAHLEREDGSWVTLPDIPLRRVGLSEEDMLIPSSARSHRAYRVLTEYFAFPEKFNFFDIDLGALMKHAGADFSRAKLHLSCAGVRSDSNVARMLRGLSAANLLPGCTPAINLFTQNGVPIAVTGLTVDYPVLAHAQHPHGYEVYSIDSVQMVRQRGGTAIQTEFRPFYSLRHGEDADSGGHYWVMRHDETVAAVSPGFEKRITLVDADLAMLAREKSCVSLMLSCTNRDLPSRLKVGQREGDLKLINGVMHAPIRFLRRPSPTVRFPAGSGEHWRLFSHLTLNHHSLVQEGLSALREMLTLYDLPQSASSQRLIAGIVGLDYADSATWMRRGLGPCLVHGIEVRITIDEEAFVGSGVQLFIEVIDQFLGLYVQHNSFVQLVVLSQQTDREIKRCKPRNGYQQLV